MKYSPFFQGWLGRITEDFTYDQVYTLTKQLTQYFNDHCSSGQKLIIGYDTRYFAKRYADIVATLFAKEGIKTFIANKPTPSAVLVSSSIHKKTMGTVVLTGDEFDASYLGIRVFDDQGHSLIPEELTKYSKELAKDVVDESTYRKWALKGYIEPFDATIPFSRYIDSMVNFDGSVPSTNFLMFNPLFGSGISYFDSFLHEKGLHGYTVDNIRTSDFNRLEPLPSIHSSSLYDDMIFHGSELGFMTSPDCTLFEFYIGPHRLSTREILYFVCEHLFSLRQTVTVLLSEGLDITPTPLERLGAVCEFVTKESFLLRMKETSPTLSVDHLGRFYFSNHGAADALMCGFILTASLNNKMLTTAKLEQKIKTVKELF